MITSVHTFIKSSYSFSFCWRMTQMWPHVFSFSVFPPPSWLCPFTMFLQKHGSSSVILPKKEQLQSPDVCKVQTCQWTENLTSRRAVLMCDVIADRYRASAVSQSAGELHLQCLRLFKGGLGGSHAGSGVPSSVSYRSLSVCERGSMRARVCCWCCKPAPGLAPRPLRVPVCI